jgi:hypothetical protein
MEQMDYNLLFRWFVDLGIDDPVWVPTVFTKNRDRLLTTDMSRKLMAAILAHPEVRPLLSDEHFSVDGTLVKAWASMKSFQPKNSAPPPDGDDPGGPPPPTDATFTDTEPQPQQTETQPMPDRPRQPRNGEVNFRGQKRSNATHTSVTDPDARLYKKAPGAAATLCFMGHTPMENRNGLVVQADLTHADGHGERKAALEMINRHSPGSTVSLRGRPSDLGFDPMVSPTLCPTLSTALKLKFFPPPMVNAAGIGRMMTNCALWRKASSATARRQPQRGGMAFAGRC